jgi:putative aminopeptidase FrvX
VHLDEIGFVTTHVRPDGIVVSRTLGHWDPYVFSGVPVQIITAGGPVDGVSVPLPVGDDGTADDLQCLCIDTGVRTAEEAAKLGVRSLQQVIMRRQPPLRVGNLLAGRAMDNRIGCVLLLELAEHMISWSEFRQSVILAWTSQEEVGFRGTRAMARRWRKVPVELCLAVDAYPALYPAGAGARSGSPHPGCGPVLRRADREGVGSEVVVELVTGLARDTGIPLQEAYADGHNQASVFATLPWGALDFAMAYLHSGVESIDVRDYNWMLMLLQSIAKHQCFEK